MDNYSKLLTNENLNQQVAGWATLAVVSADFADPAGVAGSILEDQL